MGSTRKATPMSKTMAFDEEIRRVVDQFQYVHLFNTTSILRHNDIAPQWHPADVSQIKVANQVLQFVKGEFGWEYGECLRRRCIETMSRCNKFFSLLFFFLFFFKKH